MQLLFVARESGCFVPDQFVVREVLAALCLWFAVAASLVSDAGFQTMCSEHRCGAQLCKSSFRWWGVSLDALNLHELDISMRALCQVATRSLR